MYRSFSSLLLVLVTLLAPGCQPPPTPTAGNIPGTYPRTLTTPDGLQREFIVYIPESAAGETAVPVLLMLHGTNQTGQVFYDNRSLWNARADAEGFIVVYPTARVYCHYDAGEQRTTTKWAAGDLGQTDVAQGALPVCEGVVVADDMAFFDALVATLTTDYVVDEKRLWVSGFSNGAQMAARLAAERSEVFAAVHAHAGNLSAFLPNTLASRPMNVLLTVGANDDLLAEKAGITAPIPVDGNLFDNPGMVTLIQPFLDVGGLSFDFTYTPYQYFTTSLADYEFDESTEGLNNSLRLVLIEGLGHSYTGQLIEPLWEFFRLQALP